MVLLIARNSLGGTILAHFGSTTKACGMWDYDDVYDKCQPEYDQCRRRQPSSSSRSLSTTPAQAVLASVCSVIGTPAPGTESEVGG